MAQNIPSTISTQSAAKASPAKARKPSFFARHLTLINFWLDALLLLNFLGLVWVAVIVQFVFPPAEAAIGYLLWGLSLSQWMDVQFAVLSVFVLGILIHLMLHWTWVCGVVSHKLFPGKDGEKWTMDDGQRTIFGVGLMIVLLNLMGLGIAMAMLAVTAPV